MTLYQVITIATLSGFSFGSEISVIVAIMTEMPWLAVLMLMFRSIHFMATAFLILVLFGSETRRDNFRQHGSEFLNEAASWATFLNYSFTKSYISSTASILILCAFLT